MKVFTWEKSQLSDGVALQADPKLGSVVFLGEEGRGRRYEKIALSRRNPAEVINGKVMEAYAAKITLPAKDGRPEKVFYVLERANSEDSGILVRLTTRWVYTKYTTGKWETIAGSPETLVSGFGAHGLAGRIGNWYDGFIVMKPGDVLKIRAEGGYKTDTYALWVSQEGKPETATWRDWENIQAVAKVEADIAEISVATLAFRQMPCYSFGSSGSLEPGFKIEQGATGPVLKMGEHGRNMRVVEIPIVGFTPVNVVASASIMVLDEKEIPSRYSWDKPEKKILYGLTQSAKQEDGAFLVFVHSWEWKPWKGQPQEVVSNAGDSLLVMRDGDVLFIPGGRRDPAHAVFVRGGKLESEAWLSWKMSDGLKDPSFYVQKGTAPWGYVPREWVGQVVTVAEFTKGGYREKDHLEDKGTGELISLKPFVLNLGYDARDRKDVAFQTGTWVTLTDKKVRSVEGLQAHQRRRLHKLADGFLSKLKTTTERPGFALLAKDLQEKVQKLAAEEGFGLMTTKGYGSILTWLKDAKQVLAEVAQAMQAVSALEEQVVAGSVLACFKAWHRPVGGRNKGDGWVIQLGGTLRSADRKEPPQKSDGNLIWDKVYGEELAIAWRQDGSSPNGEDNATFKVAKLPVGGCNEQQLAAVRKIEEGLGVRPGAFLVTAELRAAAEAVLSAAKKVVADSVEYPQEFSYHDIAYGRVLLMRVKRIPTAAIPGAGGLFEFSQEFKWGHDNLFVAWRPLTLEETATQAVRPQQPKPAENVDPLAALRNKWGAK